MSYYHLDLVRTAYSKKETTDVVSFLLGYRTKSVAVLVPKIGK